MPGTIHLILQPANHQHIANYSLRNKQMGTTQAPATWGRQSIIGLRSESPTSLHHRYFLGDGEVDSAIRLTFCLPGSDRLKFLTFLLK